MSDDIGMKSLEGISAPILAGGMDSSRQRNQDRQEARGGNGAVRQDSLNLSPEAEKQVQKLRERDREVRAHEQAHIAAGGQHTSGGASFSYQTGADGRQYAVGGSVQIDVSPVSGNPEATEEKARTVRRAALAPANPSSSDQSVAAKAAAMENKARSEQMEEEGTGGQEGAEGLSAAGASGAAGAMKRHAAETYEWIASPVFGASWQSSAGNGNRTAGTYSSRLRPNPEYVAALYAATRDSSLPQTALAPWGTGISLAV